VGIVEPLLDGEIGEEIKTLNHEVVVLTLFKFCYYSSQPATAVDSEHFKEILNREDIGKVVWRPVARLVCEVCFTNRQVPLVLFANLKCSVDGVLGAIWVYEKLLIDRLDVDTEHLLVNNFP